MRRPWRIDTADDKHSSSFKIPITNNPLRCRPPPGVDGAVGLDLWPTACVKGHGCTVRPNLNCIGYSLCSSKGNPVFHIRSAAHPAISLPLLDKPGRLTRSSCGTARPAEPFRRRLDTALAVRRGAVWASERSRIASRARRAPSTGDCPPTRTRCSRARRAPRAHLYETS